MSEGGEVVYVGSILSSQGTGRAKFWPNGAMAVDCGGQIKACGPAAKVLRRHSKAERIRLPPEELLLPGLVDCHTHLPQYGAAGRSDLPLLDWLVEVVYPLEARFADLEYAREVARRFFSGVIAAGTTTAAIHTTVHARSTEAVFRAAQRSGIRSVIGKVMMDRNAPPSLREDPRASLRESELLLRRWDGSGNGRLSYALTPRFAPVCSRRLMAGAAEIATRYAARIQTHLAETPTERDWVARLFPRSSSYVGVYQDAGLVGPRSTFAHVIHVSATELGTLAREGAGIAHCPASNLFLRSGLMDVNEPLARGIPVGLGSDVAAGPDLDMFRQMALACYHAKARGIASSGRTRAADGDGLLAPELAFHLATLGGARALHLGDRTGSLEEGKSADFITVDVASLDPMGQGPRELSTADLLSLLVYRGGAGAVRSVYVDGRCLMDRGSRGPRYSGR